MERQREVEILIVEDNPADARLARIALLESGISDKIQLVKDGVEALEFLTGQGSYEWRKGESLPKLILLDVKLPRMDGIETLEKIKGDSHMKTVPVVMLTSSPRDSDVIRSYQLGANSYMVKPIEFEEYEIQMKEVANYWLNLNRPMPSVKEN